MQSACAPDRKREGEGRSTPQWGLLLQQSFFLQFSMMSGSWLFVYTVSELLGLVLKPWWVMWDLVSLHST